MCGKCANGVGGGVCCLERIKSTCAVGSVGGTCVLCRSVGALVATRAALFRFFSLLPLLRRKSTCVFHNTKTTRDWKKKREREKTTTISEHQWQTGNRSRGGAVVLLRTQQGTIGCSSNSETKQQKSCTVAQFQWVERPQNSLESQGQSALQALSECDKIS